MGVVIKYLIAAVILFLAYNEFAGMHHPGVFDAVVLHEHKEQVTDAMGDAKYTYPCDGKQQAPSFYPYIDRLCSENVTEVAAYPLCPVYMRCPGWDYVGFDKDGKVVTKYHIGL